MAAFLNLKKKLLSAQFNFFQTIVPKALAGGLGDSANIETNWNTIQREAEKSSHDHSGYDSLMEVCNRLSELLEAIRASWGEESKRGKGSFVAFQKIRHRWDNARRILENELEVFKVENAARIRVLAAILERNGEDPASIIARLEENLHEEVVLRNEALMDKLDEGLEASDPTRLAEIREEALKLIQGYQEDITNSSSRFYKIFVSCPARSTIAANVDKTLKAFAAALASRN